MHEESWYPVAYASRAMNRTECEYIQIEKEALPEIFGIMRFQLYVYGKYFNIETDNCPLATIFNHGLAHAPFRIQALINVESTEVWLWSDMGAKKIH